MSKGFKCKQFFVAHDACAMKVSTDSLILGSWAEPQDAKKILDIGTGSGLLSLMLKQRAHQEAVVYGVEIDNRAAQQAVQNVADSPWASHIVIVNQPIQNLNDDTSYDVIITNPPYFMQPAARTNAYHQQTQQRVFARQDTSLSPQELFAEVGKRLSSVGRFYCLYPSSRKREVEKTAQEHGLYLRRTLEIKNNEGAPSHVCAFEWGFDPVTAPQRSTLVIRQPNGQYSKEFRMMCQSYYLNF
ncbi:methyltransferase [Alteromonas pelagimontana]|uniref:tRNA1(Val) (adenine(37)-N6)-methyltransferase n=1 Tax=Alteromonas pelagimontana TaxID=1858656 RepID=A0A6M4MG13_9ALTE|nr:methyltransferase [Alteromonas pelagimontana]QJR81590.1 methyltransferase [Alteromonas pelagimontana]